MRNLFEGANGQGKGGGVKKGIITGGAKAKGGEVCVDRGWGATGEAQV